MAPTYLHTPRLLHAVYLLPPFPIRAAQTADSLTYAGSTGVFSTKSPRKTANCHLSTGVFATKSRRKQLTTNCHLHLRQACSSASSAHAHNIMRSRTRASTLYFVPTEQTPSVRIHRNHGVHIPYVWLHFRPAPKYYSVQASFPVNLRKDPCVCVCSYGCQCLRGFMQLHVSV